MNDFLNIQSTFYHPKLLTPSICLKYSDIIITLIFVTVFLLISRGFICKIWINSTSRPFCLHVRKEKSVLKRCIEKRCMWLEDCICARVEIVCQHRMCSDTASVSHQHWIIPQHVGKLTQGIFQGAVTQHVTEGKIFAHEEHVSV